MMRNGSAAGDVQNSPTGYRVGIEPGSAGSTSPARRRSSDDRLPRRTGVCHPSRTARYVRTPSEIRPRTSRSASLSEKLRGTIKGGSEPSDATTFASIGAPAIASASGPSDWYSPPMSVSSSTAQPRSFPTSALASPAAPRSNAPPGGTPHSR